MFGRVCKWSIREAQLEIRAYARLHKVDEVDAIMAVRAKYRDTDTVMYRSVNPAGYKMGILHRNFLSKDNWRRFLARTE